MNLYEWTSEWMNLQKINVSTYYIINPILIESIHYDAIKDTIGEFIGSIPINSNYH